MTVTSNNMDSVEDRRPRHSVFSRMEKIVKDMQHPEKGVPVKSQKCFLTTIPCAFTGYDLLEWLTNNLHFEDQNEGLHLATLLCQHGYFFPVSDATKHTQTVKDDGTLYRFQSPYFWPSQNWSPDDVDYAIYLAKRSMRNKQRHGLEEYEQDTLNKLQKLLGDKWDFIYMQAEEQVRLAKERKKGDKMVLDGQERAFWRVQHPPPKKLNCLDEGVKRNFKPSQMAQRRKRNSENVRREIAYLEHSLRRPRMKTSKALESLLLYSEQYFEHDPFLTGPLPSNPWSSDDQTMWLLNTVLVDTPTVRRVKKWAFGLHEMLADPAGRHEFEEFLEKEYSSENIRFWQSCEDLKFVPISKVEETANDIYKEFLAAGAPCEINIDSKTMDLTLVALKEPTRFTFDAAANHIYLLMKKDSYARFLRSDQYKHLLANAIVPCPKKKFFNFGNKKKSPTPSPKAKRRGSASSDISNDWQGTNGNNMKNMGQHSFSTGNLHDLDVNSRSSKTSPFGSTGDVKGEGSHTHRSGSGGTKRLSPNSLRKKLEGLVGKGRESPSKNLDVPKHYPVAKPNPMPDESLNVSLNITVPNTTINVVAPWEDE